MTKYDEQIKRLREKRERASRLPRKTSSQYLQEKDYANFSRFFGADKHLFRLNSRLSSTEINAWETVHNAPLPEAYRAFLEHLGNGGAGPKYGVLPLAEWDMGIYLDDETRREQSVAQPCLLVDRPYNQESEDSSWLAEVAGADWEEKIEHDMWWPTVGTITICDHGCGMYEYLILNGPHRGQVFFINWLDPPIFSKGNFLDWYESWLDNVLQAEQSG